MDEIQNNAGIYFDLNRPIITNTVTSTFVEFLDEDMDTHFFWEDCNDTDPTIFENCDSIMPAIINQALQHNFKLFPNPSNGIFNLILDDKNQTTVIEIKDIIGRIKQKVTVKPNQSEVQFNIRKLNAGLYFCTISLKDGQQISLKTIKM